MTFAAARTRAQTPVADSRSWYVENGSIFTANAEDSYFLPGTLVVRDGVIDYVGPAEGAPAAPEGATVIDATDRLVLPGMISPHFHEVSCFRNPNADWDNGEDPQPTCCGGARAVAVLSTGFDQAARTLPPQMTEEERHAFATWNMIGHLRGGTTTLADLGSANTPAALTGSAERLGMRYLAVYFANDVEYDHESGAFTFRDSTARELEAAEAVLERFGGAGSGLVGGRVTSLLPTSASDELLRGLGELAERYDTTFGLHACALRDERDIHLAGFGRPQIERFAELGILNERLTLTHCAFISEEEA